MLRSRSRLIVSLLVLIFFGCEYKDLPPDTVVASDCANSLLAISLVSKTDASGCNLIDGSIFVTATAGVAPYSFSINGGPFQTANSFTNLGPGIYSLTVQDAGLCTRTIQADLFGGSSTLDATVAITADSECLGDNGAVVLTATGGVAPYTYQFGTGPFNDTSNHASKLKSGFYTITIRDANACPKEVSINIPRANTGLSYATQIKPIVNTYCAITGCHNGDNGTTRDWTNFTLFQKNAQNVKLRTGNRSMPLIGTLTDDQIKLIACWVDDGANNN
jgi:SprB repeat